MNMGFRFQYNISTLANSYINKRRSENEYIEHVIDSMLALISASKPSAVMVARMKKKSSDIF